jgi:hypothetical protein
MNNGNNIGKMWEMKKNRRGEWDFKNLYMEGIYIWMAKNRDATNFLLLSCPLSLTKLIFSKLSSLNFPAFVETFLRTNILLK